MLLQPWHSLCLMMPASSREPLSQWMEGTHYSSCQLVEQPLKHGHSLDTMNEASQANMIPLWVL